jgi:excisionase family DNA binding protein
MTGERARPDDPWLALGAASRLVGVAPDTLRRWADSGRVESFVTPGGHRRFLRSALEAMMNAPRRHRYGVDRLTGSAGTISGEVHRRMARSGGAPPWQARLTAEQRADFRRWGQRTFNLVLEYVAAGKRAERTLLLGEAEKMGALYGAEASRAGLSLAEAVEAFLFYRSPVLEAIAAHLRRRAAELADLTTAYREATAAIDGVLTALVASYREGSSP